MRIQFEDSTARKVRLSQWHKAFIIWPRKVHYNAATGMKTFAFLERVERRGVYTRNGKSGSCYWVWNYRMVIPESPKRDAP